MKLTIGQKAPEFSLYNSERKLTNLADFKGDKNVLILFFPLAFTSVCTKELCAVRDDINKYHNNNTAVIGISVDSIFTLAKYKAEQHYNFTLLSDFNKEVTNLYDVMHEGPFTEMKMLAVSKRAAFIIDKGGVIQFIEILENASLMPDFTAIDKKLADLSQKDGLPADKI